MERPSTAGGGELRTISTQITDTHAKCNETLNMLSSVAGYYESLKECDCGVEKEDMNNLMEMGKRLMGIRQSSDNRGSALHDVMEQLDAGQFNSPDDLVRAFKKKFDQLQKEGKNAVDERRDAPYRAFLAAVKKLDHEAEDADSSSNAEGDDELVVGMTHSRKDPISQANIRDPVKNRFCGHAYDRASIDEFIKQQRQLGRAARCPHAGCPNKHALRMEDILPFPEFFSVR